MNYFASQILKRVLWNKNKSQNRALIGSQTVVLSGFNIDERIQSNQKRVMTGRDSVIGCKITLERNIRKIVIGDRTYIGEGTHLICADQIEIASDY